MAMLIWGVPVVSSAEQEPTFEELVAAQAKAVRASEALMQFFYVKGEGIVYPDYFSGCYIEENILHICLVKPTSEEFSALKNLLSYFSDVIEFEYGSHSYNKAYEYADMLAYGLKEKGIKVTGWCVDERTCSVVIEVLPDYIEAANEMTKEIEARSSIGLYPKVNIKEGEYVIDDTSESTIIGGNQIGLPVGLYPKVIIKEGAYIELTTSDTTIVGGSLTNQP